MEELDRDIAPPRYIMTPALKLSEERDGQLVMANIITGQMFQFSPDAYRVLNMFAEPHAPEEIVPLLPNVEREPLFSYIAHLRDIGVLIPPDGDAQGDYFQIKGRNTRLFNAPEYDTKKSGGQLVVVGIPFGKGNAMANNTDSTPATLRNYANALNVDLEAIGSSESLGRIFPAPLEVEGLRRIATGRLLRDWGDLFVHEHEPARNIYRRIEMLADHLFRHEEIPLFIGGDHSISYPIITACSRAHPGLNIIQIDAHTDTYDHPIDRVYNIQVHHHGNFALKCMELDGVEALHQFGIRGLNNIGETRKSPKQHTYFCAETRAIASGLRRIDLPDDRPYYVTLDIDAIDPSEAPATATPVPGGLTYVELAMLLERLLRGRRIVGIDIVEIDPERDTNRCTVRLGLEILLMLMSHVNL